MEEIETISLLCPNLTELDDNTNEAAYSIKLPSSLYETLLSTKRDRSQNAEIEFISETCCHLWIDGVIVGNFHAPGKKRKNRCNDVNRSEGNVYDIKCSPVETRELYLPDHDDNNDYVNDNKNENMSTDPMLSRTATMSSDSATDAWPCTIQTHLK